MSERQTMDESEYESRAFPELRALVDALDEVDGLEAELAGDVLSIEVRGAKYVVNSQRAARQLWLAAERNAWHFDWDAAAGCWIAKKSGDELWSTLERLLRAKLGSSTALRPRS